MKKHEVSSAGKEKQETNNIQYLCSKGSLLIIRSDDSFLTKAAGEQGRRARLRPRCGQTTPKTFLLLLLFPLTSQFFGRIHHR